MKPPARTLNLAKLNFPAAGRSNFFFQHVIPNVVLIKKFKFLECGSDAHCVTSFAEVRTVNVPLVHSTGDERHESLLSGIFPIPSTLVLY